MCMHRTACIRELKSLYSETEIRVTGIFAKDQDGNYEFGTNAGYNRDILRIVLFFYHWYPFFVFLLGTGCRIGEAIRIRWDDIDMESRVIDINHSLTYYQRADDSYKCEFRVSLPKTAAVNRTIKRIVDAHNSEEEVAAKKEKREPIMIPRFSCHIFRHTFASRFCENETNIKVIQEVMGHADVSATMNIYAEANPDVTKSVIENLSKNMDVF